MRGKGKKKNVLIFCHRAWNVLRSEAGDVLSLFLILEEFEPQRSYKHGSYKKKISIPASSRGIYYTLGARPCVMLRVTSIYLVVIKVKILSTPDTSLLAV